jgi:hypothetical protein
MSSSFLTPLMLYSTFLRAAPLVGDTCLGYFVALVATIIVSLAARRLRRRLYSYILYDGSVAAAWLLWLGLRKFLPWLDLAWIVVFLAARSLLYTIIGSSHHHHHDHHSH